MLSLAPLTGSAHAATCKDRDARVMLREAGQGFNGRVLEVHKDRLVIETESVYDDDTIETFGRVTVYGRSLPATETGRIGMVVRRWDGRWRASDCDVIPGNRTVGAYGATGPGCGTPGIWSPDVRRTVELH